MSETTDGLFRRAALERLSSPEQLDRIVAITAPRSWLALAALFALLAAAAVWAVVGVLPTRIAGAGILVSRGSGVADAMAAGAGTVTWVAPAGTRVARDEPVAWIEQTELEQDLAHARGLLEERGEERARMAADFEREAALKGENDARRREALERAIAAAEQRVRYYTERVENEARAAERGFVTRQALQQTRQSLDAAEQEALAGRSDLLRLEAEALDRRSRHQQELTRADAAVAEARRRVEERALDLERRRRVLSPADGVVTESKVFVGAVVAPGQPVASVETAGEGLRFLLYIPPEHGKTVTPGMEVRIEPAAVRKEEFGTLLGRVAAVSDFPASPEGLMATLQNDQLVRRFSERGAPYVATVDLVADPDAPGGYRWTGGGAAIRLSSGTLARGEVTVRTQAPVELAIPLLRRVTGIDG